MADQMTTNARQHLTFRNPTLFNRNSSLFDRILNPFGGRGGAGRAKDAIANRNRANQKAIEDLFPEDRVTLSDETRATPAESDAPQP